ncbi:MAG: glutaminyl-peptide cyclotransferase [Sphingomonadales bacterium]|nr:glutaminyl-peptide cyclotransferase [Sphingomonadales bacterium]MBD3774455.1 glutaminyl-peptide cyclotransferase [Paracoccaceae bacterium]
MIARLRSLLLPLALAATALPGAAQQAPAPQPGTVQAAPARPAPAQADVYDAQVVATYPHDTGAYTEGLLWHDGALYESTGRDGQSQVRKVDLASGKVLEARDIPPDQFGEGLALLGGRFTSLTWKEGVAHRWSEDGLALLSSGPYPYEGWGLTSDGQSLIASDGSATLRFLDPEDFSLRRAVTVTLQGRPISRINELEMIDGLIYANVWYTPYILAIDPANGEVRRVVDLRPIVEQVPVSDRDSVLNGIAWDAQGKRLFVTGKNWPTLFEIRLVPRSAEAE